MAADSLQKLGIQLKIQVFDTEADTSTIVRLLQNNELKQMHLIFGPVYAKTIAKVEQFAKENRLCFISPLLYNRTIGDTNPYLFQLEANAGSRIKRTAQLFAETNVEKVILFHNLKAVEDVGLTEKEKQEFEYIKKFKEELDAAYKAQNKESLLNYVEVGFKKNKMKEIENMLDSTKNQIIIVPSTDKTFVLNVVTSLNLLSKREPLNVYGSSDWETYESLELEHLFNINLHFASATFVDYSNFAIIDFLKKYRDTFATEPDYLAFKSYDAMMYFSQLMMNYGTDLPSIMSSPFNKPTLGLASIFNFRRATELGGFENQNVFFINYSRGYEKK